MRTTATSSKRKCSKDIDWHRTARTGAWVAVSGLHFFTLYTGQLLILCAHGLEQVRKHLEP